jgi:hypothetical protein
LVWTSAGLQQEPAGENQQALSFSEQLTLYLWADSMVDPPCSPTAHTKINRILTLRAVLGRCAQWKTDKAAMPRRRKEACCANHPVGILIHMTALGRRWGAFRWKLRLNGTALTTALANGD